MSDERSEEAKNPTSEAERGGPRVKKDMNERKSEVVSLLVLVQPFPGYSRPTLVYPHPSSPYTSHIPPLPLHPEGSEGTEEGR